MDSDFRKHDSYCRSAAHSASRLFRSGFDWDHRDPFDRMLLAHCINRDLTLVSADARLRARDDIAVMRAG